MMHCYPAHLDFLFHCEACVFRLAYCEIVLFAHCIRTFATIGSSF